MSENGYHSEDRIAEAVESIDERLTCYSSNITKEQIFEVVSAGWEGRLSRRDLGQFNGRNRYVVRDLYARSVSWAIYTREYTRSLVALAQSIAGREDVTVLEVAAGRGVLGRLMPELGVKWLCTDIHPAEEHVIKADAMESLDRFAEADILFVSWVPYESSLDYELAKKWCGELGKTMIIVGEGYGGCTGSSELWGYTPDPDGESRYDTIDLKTPFEIVGTPEWFEDVPQWDGIHDYTSVVVPLTNGRTA